MKLLACLVFLSLLTEFQGASQTKDVSKGCLSTMKPPSNSLVSCKFDRKSVIYTSCMYVCRAGYHFREREDQKMQVCINGTWTPAEVGSCVLQEDKEAPARNPCTLHPKVSRNSFVSCSIYRPRERYMRCFYVCKEGYSFREGAKKLVRVCAGRIWWPKNLGPCLIRGDNLMKIVGPNLTTISCQLMPISPGNSLVSCFFDRKLGGYENCTYFCKRGYYFYRWVTQRTRFCKNGKWAPQRVGDCIQQNSAELPCFTTPIGPKNSLVSCSFDKNFLGYTSCTYACKVGYYNSHIKRDEEMQICSDGRWIPKTLGDCICLQSPKPSCSMMPKIPKRSISLCISDVNGGVHVKCIFTCLPGYYFDGFLVAKIQHCLNGTWLPEQIGDCTDQKGKFTIHKDRCSSQPSIPKNSYVMCQLSKLTDETKVCLYSCREGYSYKNRNAYKLRRCEYGNWSDDMGILSIGNVNIGDCHGPPNETVSTELMCSPIDVKLPNNSVSSIYYDRELGRYTISRHICFNGYYFQGRVNERTRLCTNGTWIPEIEDCSLSLV